MIPSAVDYQLTPLSTATSLWSNAHSRTITFYTKIFDPSVVPSQTVEPNNFIGCSNPAATSTARTGSDKSSGGGSTTGGGISGGNEGSRDDRSSGDDSSLGDDGTSIGGSGGSDLHEDSVCPLLTGCTSLATWIIIIATLIPTLLLLGCVESYIWFRRLMFDKNAMLCVTLCWVMVLLCLLCFAGMAQRRSSEDQKMLREKWNAISSGQRIKLWLKWGFWHSYPVELLGDPKIGGVPGAAMALPPGQPPRPGQSQDSEQSPYPEKGSFVTGSEKTTDEVVQTPEHTPHPSLQLPMHPPHHGHAMWMQPGLQNNRKHAGNGQTRLFRYLMPACLSCRRHTYLLPIPSHLCRGLSPQPRNKG